MNAMTGNGKRGLKPREARNAAGVPLRDVQSLVADERFAGGESAARLWRPDDHGARFAFDRRQFIKTLGGGLAVLLFLDVDPTRGAEEESGGAGRARGGQRASDSQLAAWLHIAADGSVTVFTGKAEMGQNIRTSLTQAIAEELPVPVASIRLVMADTDLVPYDAGTFGSRTTPQMSPQLRRVAATAREALLDLAAEHFQVGRDALTLSEGRIGKKDGDAFVTFGQLTQGKEITRAIDRNTPTKLAPQWKIMGTSLPKVDGRDFVTGRHAFSSDMTLPGMLYGRVLRPSALGAKLSGIDSSGAEGMAGVIVVHDGDFVGVAAPNTHAATRAIEAMRATWTTSPQVSRNELFEHLKKTAEPARGRGSSESGSIADGLAAADHKLEQTYTVAYIAHAPLEPRAALAEWKDGKLTVWTGTQRPFGVRSDLARAFGLGEERVRVIVPDTGSGYGGKHTGEAALEAARIAKAAGRPVKLVWTREEEFTWAYARPAGVIEIKSGVRVDGTITAWEFHNYNSGGAGIDFPYEVANRHIAFHPSDSPLRHGSYRGLAATANNFARESHLDDMARAAGMDPVEFRLKNPTNPRLRAVIEAAAEKFGWKRAVASSAKTTPASATNVDRGVGIGCGTEKGSFLATCAEVEVDRASGDVRIVRLVSAFECGAIVNPEHLLNQVEGAIVMGIGGAMFEALDFADGRMLNPHFSQYRVPRFRDVPVLDTVLLNRPDLPSAGAGETPIIAVAPAIGNAIAAATGVRLRSLPMVPAGFKVPREPRA